MNDINLVKRGGEMFGHDNSQDQSDDDSNVGQVVDDLNTNSPSISNLPTDLTTPELPAETSDSSTVSTPSPAPSADELATIKQQALQQLGPLVGNLDQPPEEKFRTTMMMIQASDDHGLIKTAYEAAQAIPDEKARAQALLDVVNEINYFSQRPGS